MSTVTGEPMGSWTVALLPFLENLAARAAVPECFRVFSEEFPLGRARAYRKAGLSLLPVRLDLKKPATALLPVKEGQPVWSPYMASPPCDGDLARWFTDGRSRIGIIAGAVSNWLEVLDFDRPDILGSFLCECYRRDLGQLADSLPIHRTPSGGHHAFYRAPGAVQAGFVLAETMDLKKGEWKTLIETRGEGHYVVAPSMRNDGYFPIRGSALHVPEITSDEREALLAVAKSLDERPSVSPATFAVSDSLSTPTSAPGIMRAGDDYIARGDVGDLLRYHGWTAGQRHGARTHWTRPGKRQGTSATYNHEMRQLYVFSSNADPFPANQPYNPFAIYTLLECDGDFARAAKELGRQGYGNWTPGCEGKRLRRSRRPPKAVAFPGNSVATGRQAGPAADARAKRRRHGFTPAMRPRVVAARWPYI
jgi:hypothetical protein